MDKLYGIEGASYDGCNGWSIWQLEGLVFSTKEKAQKYIDENLQGRISRYEVIELFVR